MITEETFNKRFEEMLGAVNKGFQGMEDRFQGLDGRFGGMERQVGDLRSEMNGRFEQVGARFDQLWNTVGKWPAPSRVDELFTRVKYIEHRLDIKPGEALQ